jgi:hypothetical protein
VSLDNVLARRTTNYQQNSQHQQPNKPTNIRTPDHASRGHSRDAATTAALGTTNSSPAQHQANQGARLLPPSDTTVAATTVAGTTVADLAVAGTTATTATVAATTVAATSTAVEAAGPVEIGELDPPAVDCRAHFLQCSSDWSALQQSSPAAQLQVIKIITRIITPGYKNNVLTPKGDTNNTRITSPVGDDE